MKNNQLLGRISQPIFNSLVVLLGLAGVGNLAISQVQISVITKVFAPEIGFYFFLYIIFGLVTFMNGLNVRKQTANPGNMILLVIFGLLAALMAVLYIRMLLNDVAAENILVFKDIAFSVYLTGISGAIYGLGSLIMVLTNKEAKRG